MEAYVASIRFCSAMSARKCEQSSFRDTGASQRQRLTAYPWTRMEAAVTTRGASLPSSSDLRRIERILTSLRFARGRTRNLKLQQTGIWQADEECTYGVLWSSHSSVKSSSVRSSSYCRSALIPFRHSSAMILIRTERSTCTPAATYTSQRYRCSAWGRSQLKRSSRLASKTRKIVPLPFPEPSDLWPARSRSLRPSGPDD